MGFLSGFVILAILYWWIEAPFYKNLGITDRQQIKEHRQSERKFAFGLLSFIIFLFLIFNLILSTGVNGGVVIVFLLLGVLIVAIFSEYNKDNQ